MPKLVVVNDSKNTEFDMIYIKSALYHLNMADTPIVDIDAVTEDTCVLYFDRIVTPRIYEETNHDRLNEVKKKAKSVCLIALVIADYSNQDVDFSGFDEMDQCAAIYLAGVECRRSKSGRQLWIAEAKAASVIPTKSEWARLVSNEHNPRSHEKIQAYLRREGVILKCSCVIL